MRAAHLLQCPRVCWSWQYPCRRGRPCLLYTSTVALAEQGACQLSYLEEDSQIKKGDLIVTSGASGLFPKNIVIGLAGELQTAEHGISSYTTVTPVFDIKSVSQVFVVTDFDGKSQEGENG